MCRNRQQVLVRISHTTVGGKIRREMARVGKTKDFDLCSLTVWVQCDTPYAGVGERKKKSSSVVENKRCHPRRPRSCYFTVAVNMKLCASKLVLSHPGMQAFWWNQAQCVGGVTVRRMPTYLCSKTPSSYALPAFTNHVMLPITTSPQINILCFEDFGVQKN